MKAAKTIQAPEGKKFVLTGYGLEQRELRIKFLEQIRAKYEKQVPVEWIENGWVVLAGKGV